MSGDRIPGAPAGPPPTFDSRAGRILVLRYHSLGDVVLTTGIVDALAHRFRSVEVATEERYLPILRGLPGVERLYPRQEIEALGASATTRVFDRVIDLQGTPGSKRLARRLGPARSLRARSAERRWVVFWGDRFPRPRIPHAIERYAEAAELPIERYRPIVHATEEDLAEARALAPEVWELAGAGKPSVALLIGASRKTKEVPASALIEAALRIRAEGIPVWLAVPPEGDAGLPSPAGGPARVSGGRRSSGSPVDGSPVSTDRELRDATGHGWEMPSGLPILRLPLGPLKAALAQAALVVSNDSGPMHLATALGVPVLALFGSTVPAFGFVPAGPRDQILAADELPCRPCSVHGRNRCWLGHWRCLREITPERIASQAIEQLAGSANDPGAAGGGISLTAGSRPSYRRPRG